MRENARLWPSLRVNVQGWYEGGSSQPGSPGVAVSYIEDEIASQPDTWRRASALVRAGSVTGLPEPGERVAVIGCGTSQYMAQAYARLREDSGHGESDAFQASEYPSGRRYQRVLAFFHSTATTEILN